MSRKSLTRLLITVSLVICVTIAPPARQAQRVNGPDEFNKTVQPFFSTNCFTCHNTNLKSGGLDLEVYKTSASIRQDRDLWEKVLRKLRSGEMPPEQMPRPDKAQAEEVMRWIETEIQLGAQLAGPVPGRVTARRLNRTEYNNTVRDLLGVDLRPADDFPQDDSGYGFDNIGDVLSLSPVLMEKYFAAAETVVRTALQGPEKLKPILLRAQPPGREFELRATALTDYDETGLS